MLILLTNDDGFYADGLIALRKEIARIEGSVVYVIAPDKERSASGHAITMHRPIMIQEVGLEGVERAWAISGTPADCVKMALDALLDKAPDLVISGINCGPNVATDIFYSGTVSAASEAAMAGIPAMAVSVASCEMTDYGPSARISAYVARRILASKVPAFTFLNLNIPALKEDEIEGIAVTRLGVRKYTNVFERRVDPRGRPYYWMGGEALDVDAERGTDAWALANNLVSVTPIQCDLTAHGFMEGLQGWNMRIEDVASGRQRDGILRRTL